MNGQVNRTYKCYVININFSDHLINIQYELILSESMQMKKFKINKIKQVSKPYNGGGKHQYINNDVRVKSRKNENLLLLILMCSTIISIGNIPYDKLYQLYKNI